MCFCILENTIFFLYNLKPSTEASKLFSDNHLADLILECPCLSSREHILVHNGKGYFMPVLHPQVACKRIDSSERACLGMHIPKDGRTLHPVFQCAVHTAYGERLIKFLKDSRPRLRIFQEIDQQGGREVVIIGESAAVRNLIVLRVVPQAAD